jgi:hypothetical protein
MPESFDPRCFFAAEPDHEAAARVLKALGSEGLLKTGCRVVKAPDCCVLCAANDDCARVPLHPRCRCRPEPSVDGPVNINAAFA